MEKLGITVSLSSGYHTQSNGQMERMNQELGRFLRSHCQDSNFDHEGLIHAVSSEQLTLRCVCYLNSVKHLFGLQFLRLVSLINLSSAAEVTLGLPFLWRSS
jgi:hypothetical protein